MWKDIPMTTKPQAIVIGAGFTGCAVAHDLALHGFTVTVIERGDIASGHIRAHPRAAAQRRPLLRRRP